jgi:hypothetical protein
VNRKIKLVWDFFGQTSEGTAKHHVIHLSEFMEKNQLNLLDSGIRSMEEFHHLAFITVNEADVKIIRDALKPHRAFVVE